ncbi:MAG: fructose-1,6-bisphosphate aldolase/phosphatase [Nitrososphaeria archaeon]
MEGFVVRTTVSVIKADVGSIPGHHTVHPKQLELARSLMAEAVDDGVVASYHVTHVGDDIQLIMTHGRGENDRTIHELAWNIFQEITRRVSKPLKLYGAGQDLLADSFSGNIRGAGPGVAELEFEERKSDPILIFCADKTNPGAWNLPLYKIFADPFNTAGLVIDPSLHDGFCFRVLDLREDAFVDLTAPEELYDLLALIGTPSRHIVERVWRRDGLPAAAASTSRLSMIAGRYVGKDDPVLIVRVQHGLPALGEVLEAFAFPHLVAGFMRGSHYGPLTPVSMNDAVVSRFDGPPRVVGLGFQVANRRLIGLRGTEPVDLFADAAFDRVRQQAFDVTDYMRRHGPVMPHLLGPEEMEYTTMPQVLSRLKNRFKPIRTPRIAMQG